MHARFTLHRFAPESLAEAVSAADTFARGNRRRMRVEVCRAERCWPWRHFLIKPSARGRR